MDLIFRKILLDEMRKQNLSDYDLSEKSGLSERTISHYRKGIRFPSLESADKLLKALGVNLTIGELLPEETSLFKRSCEMPKVLKIRKLCLANGDEFTNAELRTLEEYIKNFIPVQCDGKIIWINPDFIVSF